MKNLSNVRMTAYVSGKEKFFRFQASLPERHGCMRSIYFVMLEDELKRWTRGGFDLTISDGFHKLQCHGDTCVFYDLEFPNEDQGVANIRYARVSIPTYVRKLMLRVANRLWKEDEKLSADQRYTRQEPTISFSKERIERWLKLYGEQTGSVEFNMSPETLAFMEKCLAEDNPTEKHMAFQNSLNHIRQIALNTTRAFFQTATVNLYKDLDGFNWSVYTPKKQFIMNGGIVNHSHNPNETSWSIHT